MGALHLFSTVLLCKPHSQRSSNDKILHSKHSHCEATPTGPRRTCTYTSKLFYFATQADVRKRSSFLGRAQKEVKAELIITEEGDGDDSAVTVGEVCF